MKQLTLRKRTPSRRRRRRGGATSIWNILTGRWGRHHRLPAHVTGEGDWEVEVPQIRMSRAFAVMLVLHIVAVGGLFAFRIWGRDEENKNDALPANGANVAVAPTESGPSLLPSLETAPAVTSESVTPAEPLKKYTWHSGDTLPLVAARFGVSGSALREANPDKQLLPGAELVVPRAGRVIGGADIGTQIGQASEIFDPHAKKQLVVETHPPRAEVVPEMPEVSEIPDVIPPDTEAKAQPVVQKTTAHPTAKPLPAKNIAKEPAKRKPAASETPAQPSRAAGQRAHVVTNGDTVFNIARRYGFTAEEIAKANSLGDDYRIKTGQQLRIPVRR